MKVYEKKVFLDLLDMFSEHLSNAGCNDHPLPDTPEHRQLWEDVERVIGDGDELEVPGDNGKIWFTDSSLLSYFKEQIREMKTED